MHRSVCFLDHALCLQGEKLDLFHYLLEVLLLLFGESRSCLDGLLQTGCLVQVLGVLRDHVHDIFWSILVTSSFGSVCIALSVRVQAVIIVEFDRGVHSDHGLELLSFFLIITIFIGLFIGLVSAAIRLELIPPPGNVLSSLTLTTVMRFIRLFVIIGVLKLFASIASAFRRGHGRGFETMLHFFLIGLVTVDSGTSIEVTLVFILGGFWR